MHTPSTATTEVVIDDRAQLRALPAGSRVIPYGHSIVTVKQHSGMFAGPHGVCPARFIGLPGRLLPTAVEQTRPAPLLDGPYDE